MCVWGNHGRNWAQKFRVGNTTPSFGSLGVRKYSHGEIKLAHHGEIKLSHHLALNFPNTWHNFVVGEKYSTLGKILDRPVSWKIRTPSIPRTCKGTQPH